MPVLVTLGEQAALFAAAAAGVAVLAPLARRSALRIGLLDRPAPHKFHRKPVPYLGGVAVGVAVLAALVGAAAAGGNVRTRFVAIWLGAAAVAGVGLLDDVRRIPMLPRLAVEAAAGAGLWAAGVALSPLGRTPLDLVLTIATVLLITNAVNLLDNMDGLAVGVVAVASLSFFGIALLQEQWLVSTMAVVLAGGCVGFLPYNFPRARIFLGDAGSLFLGFLLSAIAIEVNLPSHPAVTRAAVPILVLAVPLLDTGFVVIRRIVAGGSPLRGGTDHLSHRFAALGVPHWAIATAAYALAAIGGLMGLLLYSARSDELAVGLTTGVVLVTAGALWALARTRAMVDTPP